MNPVANPIEVSGIRTRMLIGGEFRESADGSTFTLHNPATGNELARVPQATASDVDAAAKAAHKALNDPAWRDMLPAVRERLIHRLADLLEQHGDEIARLETMNQGMLLGIAHGVTVGASVQWLRYMAGWATKIHGESLNISFPFPPGVKYQTLVKREPVGVVAAIVPWNFPLLMAIWKIAPALACGNTVVLKPASETPLTALRFAELALEAGFPPGVLNVIVGKGSVAGAALVQHPLVNKIAFTGSTDVGIWIGKECAANVKRAGLELGGKSPVVVLDDCDPEMAIAGAANAIFFNQGQVCTAGSRLYVHKKQFDRIVGGVADIARNMVLGSGLDPATQMGPLVSKSHRESVARYIESGKQEGAELLAGGTVPTRDGYYLHPTVFANTAGRDLTVTREEVFGPVLVAQPYEDLEEVIGQANNSIFGLSASVWTTNLSKALRVAERIQAGTVWINAHNVVDPNMPFGGYKQSGIGREHGTSAIEAYTETKSICIAY